MTKTKQTVPQFLQSPWFPANERERWSVVVDQLWFSAETKMNRGTDPTEAIQSAVADWCRPTLRLVARACEELGDGPDDANSRALADMKNTLTKVGVALKHYSKKAKTPEAMKNAFMKLAYDYNVIGSLVNAANIYEDSEGHVHDGGLLDDIRNYNAQSLRLRTEQQHRK